MKIKLSPPNLLSQRASLLAIIMLTTFLAWTAGCTDARHKHRAEETETETGVVDPGSQSDGGDEVVIKAQKKHRKKVEVTLTARVKKLLPADTDGSPHQRFLLELSNGTTVLVAHNTELAPEVPVHEGDLVTLHGEYIWNKLGGVLHYTHHSTNRHESGWIQLNGQTYQ
ncbi:MAG: DUF3465 domain-containing protein [Cyanobacteria bacterium SZAS-4]|nr:DUF3465 domain-containing protein [Cyanobacteria bacterium SZAS-4]